jgi:TonB family protein
MAVVVAAVPLVPGTLSACPQPNRPAYIVREVPPLHAADVEEPPPPVTILVKVSKFGSVESVRVTRSPGYPAVDSAALEAARESKLSPRFLTIVGHRSIIHPLFGDAVDYRKCGLFVHRTCRPRSSLTNKTAFRGHRGAVVAANGKFANCCICIAAYDRTAAANDTSSPSASGHVPRVATAH